MKKLTLTLILKLISISSSPRIRGIRGKLPLCCHPELVSGSNLLSRHCEGAKRPWQSFSFIILTLLFLTTASALSYEQQYTQLVPLIPGTEAGQTTACESGKAYVYDAYTIYSVRSPDFEGQNIYIFKTEDGQDPCILNLKRAYYFIKAGEFGGANQFVGLLGEQLFLDQWTGRDHKRVLIIDLPTKSLSFFDWYDDPRIENDVLYYNKVLKGGKRTKKSIPCPEAEKWESEGLLPIYYQKSQVSLETMKRTVDEARTCKPVTPIPGSKGNRYGGH